MLDNTVKAERYWASKLTYQELAEEAEFSFQRDLYCKVAARYRAMAKEAFELADACTAGGGQNKGFALVVVRPG
jgi:hypothetical protein